MKTNRKILTLFLVTLFVNTVFLSCSNGNSNSASIIVDKMSCEYREDPEVLDIVKPRFSWTLTPSDLSQYGQKQTAYRIVVSDSKREEANMWDSGWVESDNMQLIPYSGKELISDRTYYWKVKVKDESGNESAWSQTKKWSTGLFNQTDWSAQWIGGDEIYDPSAEFDCNISDPWFRKTVTLEKKPSKAVMFLASIGYHELYVNGEKIGEEVLAPAVSDHTSRARYIGYDIARYLKKGENVIAIWLGTSWSIFEPYFVDHKPNTPLVIAQSDVYFDSKISSDTKPAVRIETDASWKFHASPNKLLGRWGMVAMGGELWDANKEIKDWNKKTVDDKEWSAAIVYSPKVTLSAQNIEGNRMFDEINPISIEERPDGSYRVDMGVNFAGWTNIKVKANPGDRVDFLFSERAQDEMTFNNYSAYIMGPSGTGEFKNKFNYSSGRWITIKGLKEKPQLSDVKGWMVRTAYPSASTFECSDDLQNWIYDRVRWTFENLSIGGYIVDCPQRERLGYGGDAHATSETGLFNYKLGAFYTKWMQDWRDAQGWSTNIGPYVGGGILPHTAPTHNGGGGPSWGGICVTLPWFIYQHEGDTRILEENFELIVRWLDFLESHTSGDLLRRFGGQWDYLGDWLWPGATAEGMNNNKPQTECFNNSYYAFNLATAAKIAEVLNKDEYAEKWNNLADRVRKAVFDQYYIAEDFSYSDRSMSNMAAALLGEVTPVELREKTLERLEREILVERQGHIHVGITGGAMLFKVLRDLGRDDLLYSMTSQTTYPSWGFMRENDATTIWEMWEKDLPGHSLLHSSYLYPGAWYIDGVGGIRRDPLTPGFKRFIVRSPLLKESDISWAKTSYDSPVGEIRSCWKKENGLLTHEVVVPPNSTALICIPEKEGVKIKEDSGFSTLIETKNGYLQYEVPAGKYVFQQIKE